LHISYFIWSSLKLLPVAFYHTRSVASSIWKYCPTAAATIFYSSSVTRLVMSVGIMGGRPFYLVARTKTKAFLKKKVRFWPCFSARISHCSIWKHFSLLL